MSNVSAVLTGDLIASRDAEIERVNRAMAILSAAARDFGEEWTTDLRFTRFRGDGWQVHLAEPKLVLDAALMLMTRLRAADIGIDTRVSAGIGQTETLGTRDLSDASGTAFFIAGAHLDEIGRRRRLIVAGTGVSDCIVAIFDLMDFIVAGWSPAQAEAVALSLASGFPTQEDIAGHLGITRQAVQARLSAAGFNYLDNALYSLRTHDFAEAAR